MKNKSFEIHLYFTIFWLTFWTHVSLIGNVVIGMKLYVKPMLKKF